MKRIICEKNNIEDYYQYLAISDNDIFFRFTSKKIFDIGFILNIDHVTYNNYSFIQKLYIASIFQLISTNLILNYHYVGLFNLLQEFLNSNISLSTYLRLELNIIKYIGYEISYQNCSICGAQNPEFICNSSWQAICSNHQQSTFYIKNPFFILNQNTFLFIENFLIFHNILNPNRLKIKKNIKNLL